MAMEASGAKRESWLARLRGRDHTQGSLLASVLALSLPSIATSIVGAGVYQMGDLWLLGKLGPEAVAASGAATQTFRQLLFLFLMGIQTASQMFVARLAGQGRIAEAEHVAGQTLLLGLVLWAISCAAALLGADALASLLSSDASLVSAIALFTRVTFALLLGPIAIQLGSSVLAGAGDTTTPMIASFVMTPVMLAAEWALGFGGLGCPELGLAGIALGAGIGGLFGGAWILAALLRGGERVRLRAAHFAPDPVALARILRAAWQPSLHMLARTGIVFFFTWLAGRIGPAVLAAYSIGMRVEMLAIMVAFPIANACATLVGQNLGAGRPERVWRAVRMAFLIECAALWPLALALVLWRVPFVGTFTTDPAVAALSTEYLAYSAALLTFYGLYFVAFRTLQAAGDMLSPMIISVSLAFGVGIPLALLLATRLDYGATGMWIANLTYAVLNAAAMLAWLARGTWLRAHARPPVDRPAR